MKSITILYTRDKTNSINDQFAIFRFVVYNQKDFDKVIRNIEEHYDGTIIECSEEMKGMDKPYDETHFGRTRKKEARRPLYQYENGSILQPHD